MQSGFRGSLASSHSYQNLTKSVDRTQQFNTDMMGQGRLVPTVRHNIRTEYGIQKYVADEADDPFIPSGIITGPSNAQSQQQNAFYSGNLHHSVPIYANHDDSGYGGSRVALTVTSPSINAGQEGSRQESNASSLQCPECPEFKAKNKSELRKHVNRHTKPHKCDFAKCHKKGFATANDLERHKRTVHRDECRSGSNSIVYKCSHCADQPGKQNKRKKQEWPRKDNFIAHLARIHNLHPSHADNLDQYIVRSQVPPDTLTDIVRENNREAARGNDLTGVGTLPDFINPGTVGNYAKQIPNLQGDQTAALAEQRLMKILQNNYSHLGNNMFESQGESQFINPDALRQHGMSDRLLDASLESAHSQSMDFSFVDSQSVMNTTSQNHPITGNMQYQGISTNFGGIDEIGMENEDTDTWISHSLEHSNPVEENIPERTEPAVPPSHSDHTANHTVIRELLKKLLPTPVDSSASLIDHVKKLRSGERDALLAALRASGPDDDDGSTVDGDPTSKGQTACCKCGKSFRRPCELTKHMKRHSKPYGCTWRGCFKTFGSKNDWKRHESKQHYHLETWKCDLDRCQKRRWNRRETFKQHLAKDHNLINTEDLERKLEQCRHGTHCEPNFWCGFCVKYIDVDTADGYSPWAKRFDHIDNHFCGRDGMEPKSIEEWHQPNAETPQHAQGGLSARGPSEAVQSFGPNTNAALKRKADLISIEPQPPGKKQNTSTGVVEMWDCCECYLVMNIRTSPSCVNCNHVRCSYCNISQHYPKDEGDLPDHDQLNGMRGFGEQDLVLRAS